MEIKTIQNEVINTDKCNDMYAQVIETVEKSGIYEFAEKHNGLCFMILAVPGQKAHVKIHLDHEQKMNYFLKAVGKLFEDATKNKFKLAIIPVEEKEEFGGESEV